MDRICTAYSIDGWYIQFPQEWKMSLDKTVQPPQVIFDVEEAPVTIYISTWTFQRPETGEQADKETVSSLFLQAFHQRGIEILGCCAEYCPDGFVSHVGKSVTEDGYTMVSCAVCTDGRAVTFYFVFDEGTDIGKYLKYVKLVEREQAPPRNSDP